MELLYHRVHPSIYIYRQIQLTELVGQIMYALKTKTLLPLLLPGRHVFSAHTSSRPGPGGQRRKTPGCCVDCLPLCVGRFLPSPSSPAVMEKDGTWTGAC